MKERLAVEVVANLLEVINRLVAELQDVADAEAARDRKDGEFLTGNNDGEIHIKYGVVLHRYT